MHTKRATMLKLTVGAVALAVSLTACQSRNSAGGMAVAAGDSAVETQPAVLLIAQSDSARAAGNAVAAVSFAELAVTADPQNSAARVALAKAYLAAGRFQSASEAYGDVAAMNPGDASARFRSALAQLAAGDRRRALTSLEALSGEASFAADVGLALALAGEEDRAVDLLAAAVRGGNSSARVRQNLALAQALAGEWAAARITASVDLAPDAVDARVANWAELASNSDSAWRTARVLGVDAAVTDGGRPAELAWAPPSESVQLADASPVQVDVPAAVPAEAPVTAAVSVPVEVSEPVVLAAAEPVIRPEPVAIQRTEVPAELPPKPLVFDGPAPKPAAKPEKPVRLVTIKATPPLTSFAAKPAVKRQIRALPKPTSGEWVVQLGSYAKPEYLNIGWRGLLERTAALGDYKPMKSSVDLRGATYHRLSVGSFPTSAAAGELCASLRESGHQCFVRKSEAAASADESKRA